MKLKDFHNQLDYIRVIKYFDPDNNPVTCYMIKCGQRMKYFNLDSGKKLIASYREWMKDNLKPHERYINGLDNEIDGRYSAKKEIETIERSLSIKEKTNQFRNPQIKNMSKWVDDYKKIYNEDEIMSYLELTEVMFQMEIDNSEQMDLFKC